MLYFTPSALKTYLAIRFRTIWNDNVQLPTSTLANITGLSEDSVRKALQWLQDPNQRPEGPARELPVYITTSYEPEHEYTTRQVQTIYVQNWQNPRRLASEITNDRGETNAPVTPSAGIEAESSGS